MKRLYLLISVTAIFISGCTGMQWYKGAVIQYKTVEERSTDEYYIHVMGSLPHSRDDLLSAVLEKANQLCEGDAEEIESKYGSYQSTSYGGGAVISTDSPEIRSIVKCVDA
ncbi:hypothetical protein [Kangiella sp. M94]